MSANNGILRLATYMCPGIPVEYYEFLAEYLEQQLGLHTELLYSSRSRGPDSARGDQDRIDIGNFRVGVLMVLSGCCHRFSLHVKELCVSPVLLVPYCGTV